MGFVIGSLFDNTTVITKAGQDIFDDERAPSQGSFFMGVLVLSAAVMNADGRKLKSELDYIKGFLVNNFGEEQALRQLQTLRSLLDKDIPVRSVCLQIQQHVDHPSRLQLMHYLFGIAAADGQVDGREEHLLHTIAGYLHINDRDMAALKAMYVKSTGWAYDVLEVDEGASDEDVKKAYRRMASRFHPDKVSSLGEDATKAANEKFQKVQQAYEEIKKKRGIK